MLLLDVFRNYWTALNGSNVEFEELLRRKDISGAKDKMTSRLDKVLEAMKEYDTYSHEIMKRQDKLITDKNGNYLRTEKVWKLPIAYPVYINEIALVFIYGRPVKWQQVSEGTDRAFERFIKVLRDTRFDAKIRQAKRLAGAETESAMLFRTFRNNEGKPDVQIRVLARSKGDEIYTRWDTYENLLSLGWGYYTKEAKDETVYHFDIFTADTIYHCTKKALGWDVTPEQNLVGKIPVVLFQQEKEWKGVEHLIHREEYIASRAADTNDYFSDPIAIMNADVIKNMPEKKEAAKVLVTNDKDGVNNAARYLTWDSAPESKKQELEWLQEQILTMSFTPKISLESLKSVSQLSAKALKTVMMLADIKASRAKESHDELLSRVGSLVTSIVGNVLDVSLKGECDKLEVSHEFQSPFGEDVSDDLANIVKAMEGGILSAEGGLELNPLIKDVTKEQKRLESEKEAAAETQASIFGERNDGAGPQTMQDETDGDDTEDEDAEDADETAKTKNKKTTQK